MPRRSDRNGGNIRMITLKNDMYLWRPGGEVWRAEITITQPTKAEMLTALDRVREQLQDGIPDET